MIGCGMFLRATILALLLDTLLEILNLQQKVGVGIPGFLIGNENCVVLKIQAVFCSGLLRSLLVVILNQFQNVKTGE